MSKIRIRVLRPFTLPGGAVAEVGTVIDVDPLIAYDIPPAKGQVIGNAEAATAAINEAAKDATNAAARLCGPIPRTLLSGESSKARWSVMPADVSGYGRPRVH